VVFLAGGGCRRFGFFEGPKEKTDFQSGGIRCTPKWNKTLGEVACMLEVPPAGFGTFLLTSLPFSSCLAINPRKVGVETRHELQAPIDRPSAFYRCSARGR